MMMPTFENDHDCNFLRDYYINDDGYECCKICGQINTNTQFVADDYDYENTKTYKKRSIYKSNQYFKKIVDKYIPRIDNKIISCLKIEKMNERFKVIQEKLKLKKYNLNYKFILYKLLMEINEIELAKELYDKICKNKNLLDKYEDTWKTQIIESAH